MVPAVALIPLGRIASDWMELARVLEQEPVETAPRGFDWVVWNEEDGNIVADYVFGQGPAYEAGIREGDVFYTLGYQQYFNADDLSRVVEGVPPGSERTYEVVRGEDLHEATVTFLKYPTFLYPLAPSLWLFSIWGFTFAAFLHVLALVIAGPLSLRSRKARSSLVLIAFSSLWIFANAARLVCIQFIGPPEMGTLYSGVFQSLTTIGLIGWIGFPVLLLRKVLRDTQILDHASIRYVHYLIYLPPLVLGGASFLALMAHPFGPFSLDNLIAPLLFYVSCYIAAAATIVLGSQLASGERAPAALSGWSRVGSTAMLFVAAAYALGVLGVVPVFGSVTETTAGWLIVAGQLLTVAPVALVSFATLRHGKLSLVMSRTLAYVAVLGLIFFTYVAAYALIEPVLPEINVSPVVAGGLLVVLIVLIFERAGHRLQRYLTQFLAVEAARKRRKLQHLQEEMHDFLDLQALTHQTVQAVGQAFDARSAVLYLRLPRTDGPWTTSTYHPEPPYMTERLFERIWPHLREEQRIWAGNPELNESSLSDELAGLLIRRRAVLAVPILSEHRAIGLLILGHKRHRRDVYNLEDLDLLRRLSSQLALCAERLHLVEREKALVRATAEAQLTALRAQINPHFLFNALNTIISLIEEQPHEAEVTVERLAGIYRHILRIGSRPFVSLEEELALVDRYLQIEQVRFGDKMAIEWDVDPDVRERRIPAFVVQTLVENAVKHGLEPQGRDGTLRIAAHAHPSDADALLLTVYDTGGGIPELYDRRDEDPFDESFFGIGLQNVTARLAQLYGRDDLFRIESSRNGTTIRLHIPPSRSEAFQGDMPPTPSSGRTANSVSS